MPVTSIRVFLDLLKSAANGSAIPAGLKLNLGNNRIGDAGVKDLAEALRSGQCPSGLQLNLYANNIGDAGVKDLAEALRSGQCPSGLQLNLYANNIGEAGAKALAEALRSGQCPSGLQLNLSRSGIGEAGAKALAEALSSGQCPPELTLDVRGNDFDDIVLNQIHALLKMNQKRHIAMGYTAFYRGVTPLHPVLKKMPGDAVAQHILSFLSPCTPKENLLLFRQIHHKALPKSQPLALAAPTSSSSTSEPVLTSVADITDSSNHANQSYSSKKARN